MISNLLASGAWKTAGSIVLAILILLVMITIHEFGHYVAGKILKFKIDEFSIGFGPALFKKKSKKSDEIFALRLIPLGGYCAFHGEDGLEEEEKQPEPFPEVTEETPQEGAAEVKQEAPAEEKPEQEQTPDESAFTKKKPWQRIIVLVAGAFMNYVLALFLILICFFSYGQTMMAVRGIAETDNAEYAAYSLQAGDILLQAEGKSLYLTTDIVSALNKKKEGTLVEFVVAREGEEKPVKVTVMLRADVEVKNSTAISSVWKALGIGVEEREDGRYYMLDSAVYRFGFFETIGRSFVYSFKIAGSIFKIIGELLTGKLGITAIGGPVTTVTTTAKVASQNFRSFLEIASYIGVNLAVFNLLPIPALDGSKVVFTVIEWIRKKPLSRKVEAIIHAVGFVLLLGFAVLVDILQFVL